MPDLLLNDMVLEYLEPIPGRSETGNDAANEEAYFKLNMEIQKPVPDYKVCIEYSEKVLKEKSKDLKVAVWLAFALFRVEKMKGLRNGLLIILQFLKKYGSNLFPANELHKSKAIQFLNSSRVFKLVEKEDINRTNLEETLQCYTIINEIIQECGKLFKENPPVITAFVNVLKAHADTANEKQAPQKESKPEGKPESVSEKAVTPSGQVVEQKKQSFEETKVGSEKEAVVQIKKLLTYFYEETVDGVKKERVPELNLVFGLSRQLQWSRLVRPPEAEKITQIEAPNQIMQGKLKEWYAAKAWDKLIPKVEINFLKGDSEFQYWLDAQRYIVKALEIMGGNFTTAADDIKYQLSKLLSRIPDLPKLKFKDKTTSFADPETIKWINDEVLTAPTGGKPREESISSPIMGEEYEKINEEYKAACSKLPAKFEEALGIMQEGILSDTRRKGKFLRRLNIANLCFQAKEYNLAKVNLIELDRLIDEYNLTEWEPALCTAVWQSEYLTNSKLISEVSKEQVYILEKEQKDLFSKIAKQNGILALKLTKKK